MIVLGPSFGPAVLEIGFDPLMLFQAGTPDAVATTNILDETGGDIFDETGGTILDET